MAALPHLFAVLYVLFAVVYVIFAVLYVLPSGSHWEATDSVDF